MDMFVIIIGVVIFFAFITAFLAKRKGRNPFLWGLTAACGLILTLIGLAFFGDLKKMTPEQAQASKTKEKIFCGIVICLGLLNIASKVLLLA